MVTTDFLSLLRVGQSTMPLASGVSVIVFMCPSLRIVRVFVVFVLRAGRS